jgi:uncharacterized membrane protein YhaH (DUF805 family)
MTFTEAVKSCLSKYVTFRGRAARSEFWFFWLFSFLVLIVSTILDGILGTGFTMINPATGLEQSMGYGYVYLIAALALLLPSLAAAVRRLHDTNRSGWWLLIALIPLIGAIVLLVWYCTKGTPGDNQYGPDPLGGDLSQAFA